jgi:hypothetical protein
MGELNNGAVIQILIQRRAIIGLAFGINNPAGGYKVPSLIGL